MTIPDPLQRILDLARWAPSGDNTQPWRFEVVADDHVRVHGRDTRAHCVYDLDGHASQMAHGALLETLALASSVEHLTADIQRQTGSPETTPVYDIRLRPGGAPDPLAAMIERRSVQRRALSTRPLAAAHKAALAASVPGYRVVWFESVAARWAMARLMSANGKNRLTMPEAYPTHRAIIEWGARFSEDRIPEQAIGVDPMTARLMHWALGSWARIRFLNTWLAGTLMPRMELDFMPGLRCAAHFALVAARAPQTIDDYVAAGRALQRGWLTATQLGLHLQPEMTPVIFSRYVREGRDFTQVDAVNARARRLAAQLDTLFGADTARQTVFIGRLGYGHAPWSRSLRRPLSTLIRC